MRNNAEKGRTTFTKQNDKISTESADWWRKFHTKAD